MDSRFRGDDEYLVRQLLILGGTKIESEQIPKSCL